VLAGLVALAVAGCGGDEDSEASATTAAATTAPVASGCRRVSQPPPKGAGRRRAPTQRLTARTRYRLNFRTSCGSFTVTLDQRSAPRTTASLVALARARFFDRTVFHRIVPNFVIQGGDPTGTGMGGPGYKTVDRPRQTARYTRGVVAMAKTATEPAGTSGSQFFVVTAELAQLPPDYAIVGRVTAGSEVVQRIGRLGDPSTEQPLQPVVVERVTVATS